ncbi:hypothetical protein Taro_048682 [Colocasia esculenta]|uniref:Uncharacterized protein n=1 Tax=Colocasia esculenta TaxID=4460 RepID=A0A843X8U0_COLES|nr:hypothetical protein [Colocasia esculenta]
MIEESQLDDDEPTWGVNDATRDFARLIVQKWVQTSTSRQSEAGHKYIIVTAVVWPDYGPTPSLSKQFWGHKERGSEKRTDWPTPGRTPNDLGVPDQPREVCKQLNTAVLTTIFPSAPESMTRACPPPGVLLQQARGDGGPRQW